MKQSPKQSGKEERMSSIMRTWLAVVILFFQLLTPVLSETRVGGTLKRDTVWSFSASPYVVTSTIWVPKGKSLKIEPGVEVRFLGPHVIYVDGELKALGRSDRRILFTSHYSVPAPGDWSGIVFSPLSMPALFSTDGEYFSGSAIINSEISYGGPILIENTSPFISDNFIHHVKGVGLSDWPRGAIWACASKARIQGNTITLNDVSGVVLLGSEAKLSGNVIIGNTAGADWGGGIMIGEASCRVVEPVTNSNQIGSNFIGYNRASSLGGGIGVHGGAHAITENCIVGNQTPLDINAGAAIGVWSGGVTIEGNSLVNNKGKEAVLFKHSNVTVQKLHGNSITNDAAYEISIIAGNRDISNGLDIEAFSNFWGIQDLISIGSRFFIEDNASQRVLFDSGLEVSKTLSACDMGPTEFVPLLPPQNPIDSQNRLPQPGEALFKSVRVFPEVFDRTGGIAVVKGVLSGDYPLTAWVTLTLPNSSKRTVTTLNCARRECTGILKIPALKKNTSKGLKTAQLGKVNLTAYASLNSKIVGTRRVKLKFRGKRR